jgi:Gluconate 2-dehydrogenase subunit 3
LSDPYRFFNPQTKMTFSAVAACVVPAEPGSPGADSPASLRIADRAIAERPERDRRLLGTFLLAVEALPRLRHGRGFSRLRREQQEAFLRFLENSWFGKLRQGFFGVKTFALLGYYGQDETWRELGYPGPRSDAPFYTLRKER